MSKFILKSKLYDIPGGIGMLPNYMKAMTGKIGDEDIIKKEKE